MIEWYVKGLEFGNCNCDYGCPCQFNALPTTGNCESMGAFRFDEGRFGDVALDGTMAAFIAKWPGPVHEGQGTMQYIVDDKTSPEQQDALLKILSGQETQPMATMWSVYAAMSTTFLEPLVRPIELEIDVEARRGRFVVENVVETTGEPIRNPVTGDEHRARIDLPSSFEFRLAEVANASTKTGPDAGLKLRLDNSYGQFAEIHLSHSGRLN
jgi:hypothetical protein